MSLERSSLMLVAVVGAILMFGCADETSQLNQKIADLDKRLQKQEKELKEFSGKFSLPRDFSADIQRIEDQQDRISQVIKTKVEPVNAKLEEFRDWAQEAQKERDEVRKKLKSLEDALMEQDKHLAEGVGQINRVSKAFAADRKSVAGMAKGLTDLSKALDQLRKEFQDNNKTIVEAVKKTLPKVKDAAVAELKASLTPLEQQTTALKAEVETDRKAMAALKAQAPAEDPRVVQALNRRIRDLEEILTSQKAYLLEVGSKVHELELQLRRSSGADGYPESSYSRR